MSILAKKPRLAAAALALLGACSFASAVPVAFFTTGSFTGTGASGNTLTQGGVTVTYTGTGTTYQSGGTPGPVETAYGPSSVNFGSFMVSGPSSGSQAITANFTLTINQVDPTASNNPQSFGSGTVSGTLYVNASQAYVQFTSPLSVQLDSIPYMTYAIQSHDSGQAGRVNLNPQGAAATIAGQVTAAPLPSVAWLGLVLVGGVAAKRSRRSADVA